MRKLVEVRSSKNPKRLGQLTAQEVDDWFRDAWPGLETYPPHSASHRLAVIVQGMADRAEARSADNGFVDVYKARSKRHRDAQKAARALKRSLQPFIDGLQLDLDRLREFTSNITMISPGLESQISVAESTRNSVEHFLEMPIIFAFPDHEDSILVISDLAKKAWQHLWASGSSDEKAKIKLGLRPEDPLVTFIRSALESIGWASAGIPGHSLDTISEHLRGRQNRPRRLQKAVRKGG